MFYGVGSLEVAAGSSGTNVSGTMTGSELGVVDAVSSVLGGVSAVGAGSEAAPPLSVLEADSSDAGATGGVDSAVGAAPPLEGVVGSSGLIPAP